MYWHIDLARWSYCWHKGLKTRDPISTSETDTYSEWQEEIGPSSPFNLVVPGGVSQQCTRSELYTGRLIWPSTFLISSIWLLCINYCYFISYLLVSGCFRKRLSIAPSRLSSRSEANRIRSVFVDSTFEGDAAQPAVDSLFGRTHPWQKERKK